MESDSVFYSAHSGHDNATPASLSQCLHHICKRARLSACAPPLGGSCCEFCGSPRAPRVYIMLSKTTYNSRPSTCNRVQNAITYYCWWVWLQVEHVGATTLWDSLGGKLQCSGKRQCSGSGMRGGASSSMSLTSTRTFHNLSLPQPPRVSTGQSALVSEVDLSHRRKRHATHRAGGWNLPPS